MIKVSKIFRLAAGLAVLAATASHVQAQSSYFQGFNGTALPTDWTAVNNSTSPGNAWIDGTNITDGTGAVVVSPQEGNGFAIASYQSTTSTAATGATISNFLISPRFTTIRNGDTFSFYTTTSPGSQYPDRLQFLLSTNGASTNVGTTTTSLGDFAGILLTINPNLAVGGYPEAFTQYTATISGLTSVVDGRVALRYFVTDGGPNGINSNIIGVDSFRYTATAVPEPATFALVGLGGLGLVLVRRARRS